MPNPIFEPIIGRDFDSIGQQRLAWAGFNANIEAQNLARAAAAEEAQNRWAGAYAQMQREDAMRQATLDANARNVALNLGLQREQYALGRQSELEQAARQERQFGEQMKFAREDLAARGDQAEAKTNLLQEQQKARIDFNGERYAAEYGLIKSHKAAADAALEAAQAAFDNAEAGLSVLNTKTKKSEDEIARQSSLATSLPKLKADLRLATTAANRANSEFDRIRSRMWAGDYEINEDTGKISHPLGSREWTFGKAVAEAGGKPAKPLSGPVTPPVPPSGPGWFSRNVAAPVYNFSLGIGRRLLNPFPASSPSRYAPVATIGHDEGDYPATEPYVAPVAAPIVTNRPVTGRFVRDASGRLVLERY